MSVDNPESDADLIARAKEKMAAFARIDLAFRLQQLTNVVPGGTIYGGGTDHAEHRALLRQAVLDLIWATEPAAETPSE
jgi:hypothetical protein